MTSDHARLGSPALGEVRETSSAETAPHHDLTWLIRLRWLAAAGQVFGYYVVAPTTAPWARSWLLLLVVASVLSNVSLHRFRSRVAAWGGGSATTSFRGTGLVLTFDCALLTAWLAFTGATTNPFTSLYLVHIVLGAVVLNARWTVWLISWAALCFGVLFLVPSHACCVPDPELGVESAYLSHMQGMWFSFATAAILISYFVRQLTLESERQRERIASLRLEAERSAHMASLTTLAAGAAHELRTPLATIAVAAHELRRNAERMGNGERLGNSQVLDDAALIAEEVQRCQDILSGMGLRLRAGAEPRSIVDGAEALRRLGVEFSVGDRSQRLTVKALASSAFVSAVEADLVVALRGLVNNALDATETRGEVQLACEANESQVTWTIKDTGVGMSEQVRARATEPFFTTKPPGKGVGLGLFVAYAFALSTDGKLLVDSTLGEGTTVRLVLPRMPAASETGP